MKVLCLLALSCTLASPALAIDREAFTFTRYDLNATIDPDQQRFGVRGKVTLRNDSDSPQYNVVLQISSTLHWLSIQVGGKPAEFVAQAYNSDIDHTGALSEAIVTLPRPIPPKDAIEISVGYEGVIPLDATRQTRIGVPADTAKHSDWDQITPAFTAVRGIGHVAWYPIASEAANISDASTVSEAVGRWQRRAANSEMRVNLCLAPTTSSLTLLMNDAAGASTGADTAGDAAKCTEHFFSRIGEPAPFFVAGSYAESQNVDAMIHYLPRHKSGADDYMLALQQVGPWLASWLGNHQAKGVKTQVIDLPDAADSPFQAGTTLLIPLTGTDTSYLLAAVHQLTSITFPAPRQWVSGGLALYAQARYMQDQKGAGAGLAYLRLNDDVLIDSEKRNLASGAENAAQHSLINDDDEFYVGPKAMRAWWMLHDLVGETAFTAALRRYKPEEDTDALHVQKLFEAESHHDLTWFFDDWVYRDRGLPDFRIASVYSRQVLGGGQLVTVTVENLGAVAAEVPVTLHMAAGDATEKLIVPGKSKASVRILAASAPLTATVNDGSVPETDMSNNSYTIESPTSK